MYIEVENEDREFEVKEQLEKERKDIKSFDDLMAFLQGEWKGMPIETLKPDPDEIIVFKFKTEPLDLNNMSQIFINIQNVFPNNTVVAIPDNSCFEVFTKNTLISFLQDIIKQLEE